MVLWALFFHLPLLKAAITGMLSWPLIIKSMFTLLVAGMFVENLLIKKIHSSPFQFNFVFTGGGSLALSHLISTPGASKTVVEAFIPYSEESMDDYLGKKQEAYCNKKVTLDLAMKARWKLLYLKKNRPPSYQVGIGLTASLSSLQEKKGDIRFHLVACGSSFTTILTVV